MGLDICAYSKIHRISPESVESDPELGNSIYPNPDFIAQADGLEAGRYTSDASLDFRAGSYSGYGQWRDDLAALAGYPRVAHRSTWERESRMLASAGAWATSGGPFWELINFSDCEGAIGPKTSAKLAADFAEFQAKADAHPDEWFRDRYALWRKAFELAAQDGAVHFC